jgi:hypothetical protein
MTKQDCLNAAVIVCECYGFADFAAMHDLIIGKGFHACPVPITLHHWNQVEKAFHTAQFLMWAAEETGSFAARAYWIEAAAKRLPPMSAERWSRLPQLLKSAA